MNAILQDLRYGARLALKNPSLTMIALFTLALGIGATTAIFSVVNAVLLRPLPYPESERLLYIGQRYASGLAGAGEPKFLFWREQSESFEAMAAYSSFGGASGNLSGGDEAEYVSGARVSVDIFRVLGVYPALGRAFTTEEDTPGGPLVAIISDGLWRRRFGGDRDLIGRTLLLNDRAVTVVGVMPPQFHIAGGADLLVPMKARIDANYDPNAEVIGRLKPGVTSEQAEAELKMVAEKYRAAFPRHMQDGESIGVESLHEYITGGVSRLLWFLLGAVAFLLLIACANVANLQLARASSRGREMAVRLALGASGNRIARQLLTEGLLLALVGGGMGLLLAVWGVDLLLAFVPEGLLPGGAAIGVDARALLFALGASLATGFLFGLAPAWQARRVDVQTALKESAGKGGTARGRMGALLVVAEVALSLVLLIGAGLLLRTFLNLSGVAPGFDPNNLLTAQIALNGPRYDTTAEAAAFYRDALERVSRIPGVETAAITNKLPLDWQFNLPVLLAGQPDKLQSVQFRMITPDYFRAMRIRLEQGREFTADDNAAAPPVIIINRAFAERYFSGQDPFAARLSIGRGTDDPERQVVGIVGDIKQTRLDRPAPPMVYVPIEQMPDRLMATVRAFTAAHIVVRTSVELLGLAAAIKREVAAIDPTLGLAQVRSMEQIAERSVASQRFNMLLIGLFAVLGLGLAGVGIYGVISYGVAQRTPEIGIRLALGAERRDVIRMVLREGLVLAIAGTALGIAGAFALTRLMSGWLYGVSAYDPLTFGLIAVLIAGVALAASYLPARRAARVDPIIALRYE